MDDQVASLARTQIKTSPRGSKVELNRSERQRINRNRQYIDCLFQVFKKVIDDLYLDMLNPGDSCTGIIQHHMPHDSPVYSGGGNKTVNGLLLTRTVFLVDHVNAKLTYLLGCLRHDFEGVRNEFIHFYGHYANRLAVFFSMYRMIFSISRGLPCATSASAD